MKTAPVASKVLDHLSVVVNCRRVLRDELQIIAKGLARTIVTKPFPRGCAGLDGPGWA
jgi:hypothetical protein